MSKKNRRQNVNRNKEACARTKQYLISNYGTRCWLCGNDCGRAITHHHIKPRHAGGNDSIDNGSLLCRDCHDVIHQYKYSSTMYMNLTRRILEYKS